MDVNARRANYWNDWGAVLLWASVLSGPAAWALNQLIGYALVKPACAGSAAPALTFVSAGALAIVVAGGWTAWWCFGQVRNAREDGAEPEARSLFMSMVGVGLNALIAILILTAAVPPFVSPCQ
jgi:hypothetical protein